MSSPDENVSVAREGLAAFQRGDVEAFLDFLDPEVELISPPELPNPTHSTGRDGYVEWVTRWLEAWESFEVEPDEFEPAGERHVVMRVTQRGIGKGSGIEVEMKIFYMLEIRDRRATRIHLYADREQALSAAEAGEAAG
jgi:ketosteroid isomerase-like protein